MDHERAFQAQPPPTPPPLPEPKSQKVSKLALKVAAAPPGWAFESSHREEAIKSTWDPLTPPAGTYFFYGTLQDPKMLAEVLDLKTLPKLRPAYVIGYDVKLWDQYPALVNGEPGTVIEGSLFEVPSEAAAARLAEYETKNYWPSPCAVRTKDDGVEKVIDGFTFEFCGPRSDLNEGTFDLGVWLRRMGR